MKKISKMMLFLTAVLVGYMVSNFGMGLNAADGTIWTLNGKGSRRNTAELELREPTVGTAADLLPGTDNTNSLGTSALRWDDVQTMDLTVGDDLTVSDDFALTGNLTLAEDIYTTAQTVISVAVSTNVLTPTGVFQLIGSTGAITLSGAPVIATTTATNGQHLILLSTAAVITLQDQATDTDSLLALSAASITITTSTPVEFVYYNGVWHEIK